MQFILCCNKTPVISYSANYGADWSGWHYFSHTPCGVDISIGGFNIDSPESQAATRVRMAGGCLEMAIARLEQDTDDNRDDPAIVAEYKAVMAAMLTIS